MTNYHKMIEWMIVIVMIGCALCSPMYYKKIDDDTFEPGEKPTMSDDINLYRNTLKNYI